MICRKTCLEEVARERVYSAQSKESVSRTPREECLACSKKLTKLLVKAMQHHAVSPSVAPKYTSSAGALLTKLRPSIPCANRGKAHKRVRNWLVKRETLQPQTKRIGLRIMLNDDLTPSTPLKMAVQLSRLCSLAVSLSISIVCTRISN